MEVHRVKVQEQEEEQQQFSNFAVKKSRAVNYKNETKVYQKFLKKGPKMNHN